MESLHLQLVLVLLGFVTISAQDRLEGGCEQGGVRVAEGDLIAQQDPCHICQCRGGTVECFWKSCGAPPELCEVMQVEDRCNPSLYVCPIPTGIAGAPIQAAQSVRTVTRQRPDPAPAQVIASTTAAPARSRSSSRSSSRNRSRSRSRNSSRSSSRNTSRSSSRSRSRYTTQSRERVPTPKRAPSAVTPNPNKRRQRVTTPAPEVSTTPPATPAPVLAQRAPPPPARSQVRSRDTPLGLMKFVSQPRALPHFPPSDNKVVVPNLAQMEGLVVAASVASGAYFNEELSVPRNFVMPTGRNAAVEERNKQKLRERVTSRKRQLSLGPSIPERASSRSRARSSTEAPTLVPAAAPAPVPTTAPSPAPAARPSSGRSRSRYHGNRRRGPAATPAKQLTKVTKPSKPTKPRPIPRRSHSPTDTAEPAPAAHHLDLENSHMDLASMMFPEFGRRLRRDIPGDVFDAETVRHLEAEWRRRRRRRSLLPGDDNHVHHHHHHDRDHHEDEANRAKTCTILGVQYELGEVVGVASDNCLECRCAAQALFCSPKCCFFAIEERAFREGRQLQRDRRPHPLRALIVQ